MDRPNKRASNVYGSRRLSTEYKSTLFLLTDWASPKNTPPGSDAENYENEESDPGADNSNSDQVQFLHYKNYCKIRVCCNQTGKYNGWSCKTEISLKLFSPKPERARSIVQKKTTNFDPSDNVISFYFCEWKDLLKNFLHGKAVHLEVEIWVQESINAAEVENEFLYSELEYLIKKVERLLSEDTHRENEIQKEKALSNQLKKENEDLKIQLEKLAKDRDEAYKYKSIFEDECRKLVHEEVSKIHNPNTPESSSSSERRRRRLKNIQFLMD